MPAKAGTVKARGRQERVKVVDSLDPLFGLIQVTAPTPGLLTQGAEILLSWVG